MTDFRTSALQRLSILIGEEALARLEKTHVAVFGVGGVGSPCAEALVRSGVGRITLVDADRVAVSNINRQLPAFPETIGHSKVEVLAERLRKIFPDINVNLYETLYSAENRNLFDWGSYDFVIDAIDTVTHKVDLLSYAYGQGCTVFSSLGAAGKLDPTRVRYAGIWQTKGCPLGKLVRQKLREQGFKGDFQAVYSEETVRDGYAVPEKTALKSLSLGSTMPVTAAFGMTLASLVIRKAAGE
ncbi:MAG: tRNA threonylcarbamoyladenosine dehydratase [Fibrobacter sp.]|jgi:tRNA A37 threonylcarbamoyladenosine dehydratase|nr:tRNA threonylcarbamoyladenosine dehydratase [Fibrobacter sp.]